jgi:uncharacterized membrane protein
MKNAYSPEEEKDPGSLLHRIKQSIVKGLIIIHTFFSYLILLAGLVWGMLLLEEILNKGRLPIEADARFLKGIRLYFGLFAIMFMLYGSIFWSLLTATIIWVKEIRVRLNALKIGLIALAMNSLLFYLIFFSEAGQWILD